MENQKRRVDKLEIFIKNSWCTCTGELTNDSLLITLKGNSLDKLISNSASPDFNIPSQVDDLANRKRIVKICKPADKSLGISIKGGKENRMPILISKVFPELPAYQTNELFVGDAILAVNNVSLREANHDEAVEALKNAGEVVRLEGKLKNNVLF